MAIHRRVTARNVLFALVLVLLFYFVSNPNAALLRDRGQQIGSYDDSTTRAGEAVEKTTTVEVIASTGTITGGEGKQGAKRRTAVVVASQASEDATWLDEYFPQWEKYIYRVDTPNAKLTVPMNKGRESMVYLT